jgi:hypothetical protein
VSTPKHKDVTLSLPAPLLHRFKVFAALHNQSMSSLMAKAVDKLMEQDDDYEAAKRRFIEGMRNAPDLGTGGKIPWTRDELHEP